MRSRGTRLLFFYDTHGDAFLIGQLGDSASLSPGDVVESHLRKKAMERIKPLKAMMDQLILLYHLLLRHQSTKKSQVIIIDIQ